MLPHRLRSGTHSNNSIPRSFLHNSKRPAIGRALVFCGGSGLPNVFFGLADRLTEPAAPDGKRRSGDNCLRSGVYGVRFL